MKKENTYSSKIGTDTEKKIAEYFYTFSIKNCLFYSIENVHFGMHERVTVSLAFG